MWSNIWSVSTTRIDFWTWIRSLRLNWFRLTDLITMMLLLWKWTALFLRKNHLLPCWGWLSLLNWIGALTISLLLRLLPRKLESWRKICSMKCFSPEAALYLYKSTISPYMKYCCHVWAGPPSCYLELLQSCAENIGKIAQVKKKL